MTGEIKIKVVIRDGVVESVLCDDTRFPVSVEVIDVDGAYRDYDELRKYVEELYRSPDYEEVFFTIADYSENVE